MASTDIDLVFRSRSLVMCWGLFTRSSGADVSRSGKGFFIDK